MMRDSGTIVEWIANRAPYQRLLVGAGHLLRAWGPSSIVLLSSYRFGSSLMSNFLNSHPQIRVLGEILNASETAYRHVAAAPPDRIRLHLQAMFFGFPGRRVAAKIMVQQLDDLHMTILDVIDALKSPHVIALYRQDLLSAYVSLKIAQKTGIWYSTEPTNCSRIRIDMPDLECYVEKQKRLWSSTASALRSYPNVRFLAYESLATESATAMEELFDFLGLPYVPPVTETVKQNPASLDAKVINFHELNLGAAVSRDLSLCFDEGPTMSVSRP